MEAEAPPERVSSTTPAHLQVLADGVDLPSDRGRCGDRNGRGVVTTNSGAGFLRLLRESSAAIGSTPFELGLACFVALVHRHTQQSAISVGVRHAGSNSVAPTLRAVRCELAPDMTFARLIGEVREAFDRSSPIPVSAATTNAVFGMAESSGTRERPSTAAEASAHVALTIELREDEPVLRLEHDARVFSDERMREFLAQYWVLAEQAARAPSRLLLDFSLVTEVGRGLLPDPTQPIETPRHPLLPAAVLACAERQPAAVAISHSGRTWTYSDLARTSSALAVHLRNSGVGTGDVVAVTGTRGFAVVSSMLSVFQSGGVLLTLDPKLPLERQRVMLEQASAKLLVVVGEAGELTPTGLEVIRVDAATGLPTGVAPDFAAGSNLPALDPASPAYVFFTSGSTGTPKAVRGRHAGLAHFLDWQRRTFEIGPGDRASQLTALSFDVILRDVFLALTSGATLCIPGESDVIDPGKILAWMEQERISVLHVVPSLARLWLTHAPPTVRLRHLRRVFFAGEPLTDVLVRQFRGTFENDALLINLYGPTETTLAKCFYKIGAEPDPGVQPIGQPLPQTQVLILNPRRMICGLNETGEIAIRTPFRTLGYLNAPEANARAFIPNPFRDDPDDLVYLTGDSGRYRTDGVLEILGRLDNQVKIRGMRVEPGEIEALLGHHPNIREVVVTAREDDARGKFLVAYVVWRAPGEARDVGTQIASLREYLRARLPEHMVPAAFVVLDALPLNPNGKVNKKALPAPGGTALSGRDYVPPRDGIETSLASIWQGLLKLDRIGIDDGFFDLGGDSLLAVQLACAIETELGRRCPLTLIFKSGNIRSLAAHLRTEGDTPTSTQGKATEGATLLPLRANGEGPELYCICGVHLYQALAERLAPHIRTYGFFLPYEQELFGREAVGRPSPSVEEMAAGYVQVMRIHQPTGPYLLAGVSFGGILAYEMAQQLTRAGHRVEFLAMLDSMLPSALRRDWRKWLPEKARSIRDHGFDAICRTISRSLGSYGKPSDPLETEARRLGDVRQNIYRDATSRYQPRPYGGSALLVRAQEKGFFNSDIADETYGWGNLVADLEMCDVPGDHIGMLREPHVASLAEHLRAHIVRHRVPSVRGGGR